MDMQYLALFIVAQIFVSQHTTFSNPLQHLSQVTVTVQRVMCNLFVFLCITNSRVATQYLDDLMHWFRYLHVQRRFSRHLPGIMGWLQPITELCTLFRLHNYDVQLRKVIAP